MGWLDLVVGGATGAGSLFLETTPAPLKAVTNGAGPFNLATAAPRDD